MNDNETEQWLRNPTDWCRHMDATWRDSAPEIITYYPFRHQVSFCR